MPTNRRTFLKQSAAAGAVASLGLSRVARAGANLPVSTLRDVGRARAPLDILILGGTGFTGPEQVEYALARGHRVTLLNRNRRRPDFFKGRVEQLVGDLNGDVGALKDK